jgi:hypothetical protein
MSSFKQAVRQGTPAQISLWGPTSAGKTRSALFLARGIVGPGGKIGVIDTENGRATNYDNEVGGWLHCDLQPPFTPQRYLEKVLEAEREGINALIIDSTSHVWEGEGGVLDMAGQVRMEGLGKWKTPKMEYKRFGNHCLRNRMHMIYCFRAKEKFVQVGKGKEAKIESRGMVPVCDAMFPYEMSFDFELSRETHAPVRIKRPDALGHLFKMGEPLTIPHGKAIAEWIAGAKNTGDADLEQIKRAGRDAAMNGSVPFRDWWQSAGLTKPQKEALQAMMDELKSLANEADLAAANDASQPDDSDPLDDAFTGNGQAAA